MKLLLDTHLLLLAAAEPHKLPSAALAEIEIEIENADNGLLFSAASLWEVAIKRRLGRPDFILDPRLLRRELVRGGTIKLDKLKHKSRCERPACVGVVLSGIGRPSGR